MRREALIKEYELLHKENWERGQNVWMVNSILVTGSLIVAFQLSSGSLPTPIISLLLVIIAFMIHATTEKVTAITYRTMENIRSTLGMTESTEMYQTQIRGKWWYSIRRNLPYALYLVLASTYLFLIVDNIYITLFLLVSGFLVILIREGLDSVRRESEEPRRRI